MSSPWFTSRVLTAQRKGRCGDLQALATEFADKKRTMNAKLFASLYGSLDPATIPCSSSGASTPPSAPALPPAGPTYEAPPPEPIATSAAPQNPAGPLIEQIPNVAIGGSGVPAPGTPPQAGEYYADTAAVWAGGDVTRRACEIDQPGAAGACKRYGFPIGNGAANLSAAQNAALVGLPQGDSLPPMAGGDYYPSADAVAAAAPETFDQAAAVDGLQALEANPDASAELRSLADTGEDEGIIAIEGDGPAVVSIGDPAAPAPVPGEAPAKASAGLSPLAWAAIAVGALFLFGAGRRSRRTS